MRPHLFHLRLHPFDDYRGCHATCGAHGNQPKRLVTAFELIESRTDQHGAGCTDGMTQSNGTAINIDLFMVDVKVAHEFDGYYGEGFVDFKQVYVVERQVSLFQNFLRSVYRCIQDVLGRVPHVCHCFDFRSGF